MVGLVSCILNFSVKALLPVSTQHKLKVLCCEDN